VGDEDVPARVHRDANWAVDGPLAHKRPACRLMARGEVGGTGDQGTILAEELARIVFRVPGTLHAVPRAGPELHLRVDRTLLAREGGQRVRDAGVDLHLHLAVADLCGVLGDRVLVRPLRPAVRPVWPWVEQRAEVIGLAENLQRRTVDAGI